MTDLSCLCPNCKVDLQKMRYTQFHVHLYVDNFEYPDMAEKLRLLKAKKKLNKHVMQSLLKPDIDTDSFVAVISRIESVLEFTSDKALACTLKKELNLLRGFLGVLGSP